MVLDLVRFWCKLPMSVVLTYMLGNWEKKDWTETEGRWRGGETTALVLQSEALTSSQL